MSIPYLAPLLYELRENARVTHWIRNPSIVPDRYTSDPGSDMYRKRAPLRGLYANAFATNMAKRGGALLAMNYTGAFQRAMVSFLQTPVMVMRHELIRDAGQRSSGDRDVYAQVLKHIQFLLSR